MATEWRNWAGDQRCTPAATESVAGRDELGAAVGRATAAGRRVRVAGTGHSFTDAACTEGVMVDMAAVNRLLDLDRSSGLVRVEAGIVIGDLAERLAGHGLAMENQGDIDKQTIAGAISTATHGTGVRFQNLSAQVEAVELVRPDGSIESIDAGSEGDALQAARAGIGVLGPLYSVTIRTVPAYTVRRVDRPLRFDEVLGRIDELVDGNDHFEFYAFPHTETAVIRESERTDEPPKPGNRSREFFQEVVLENWLVDGYARVGRAFPSRIPPMARFLSKQVGRSVKVDASHRVFASERRVRFTEMEYGVPRERGAEAVRRVWELIEDGGLRVSFPIEVRFVAPDDVMLSPSHRRETCYIAVHMYRGSEWETYFRGVAQIMDSYGGRPHWGKRHFLEAEALAERYPRWDDFQAVRARLDPEGHFANSYTDRVLGPVESGARA
jgi:L-gulono-1,4-lactone dehydrogenase